MTIMVIDGQGGKMGKGLVEQLKKLCPEDEILAIGTNSIATAAILKAGADAGATGENPAVVTGQSRAQKVLIPVNRCQHFVVGCRDISMGEYVKLAVEEVLKIRRGEI